jgi:hypothetical protein
MRQIRITTCLCLGFFALAGRAERINHEGRILGPLPVVTNSVLFNTINADTVVSAMQILPRDNPWNEDISRRPLLTNSALMMAQIVSDLQTNRRTLRVFFEMNYVFVPTNQPLVSIDFFNYPDESDPSPYPVATNTPVETWPRETGTLTLDQWQRDVNNAGGDRHAIIVQPGTGLFWETWLTKKVGTNWEASNGAKFNLNTNGLRPATWTSGDAAGLPMLPALIRYDECERGVVEHALRIVVKRTRAECIYPARHYASVPFTSEPKVPAMGQRVRLKASFAIPDTWNKHEKAVLNALKKYGALVADNGNFFSVSATPDQRWPSDAFSHLSSISITNFEVIQTTGPNEGPRSPGAPRADAGPDRVVPVGSAVPLQGAVTWFTNPPPVVQWKLYSSPAPVVFANTNLTNTTVTFNAPGTYTLMLSADDGVHAVAYDAVVFNAVQPILLEILCNGTNATLRWTGGNAPYVLEQAPAPLASQWTVLLTTNATSAVLPVAGAAAFFRVRGP